MSGYFGALMRASGMSVAGRAPAISRVEPRRIEIDDERSPTATPLPTEAVVSAPQRIPAPAPARDAVEQPAQPMPLSTHENVHDVHGELASAEPTRPRAVTDRSADSPGPPAERPGDQSTEDPRHAVVRAAMRWVAADPQQVHNASEVVTPPAPASPVGSKVDAGAFTGTQARRNSDADVLPRSATVTSAPMPARDIETPEPSPTQAVARRSARPVPATLLPSLAPVDHDDHVEVSIGAIHVRVDAPAVHTVARPTATPTVGPRPIAAAMTTRSTLSRRALRRI